MDMDYWCRERKGYKCRYRDFVYLMVFRKAFRSVLYYRLKGKMYVLRLLYPKPNEPLIYCDTEIGGGLFFCHGFSTIVVAKAIGRNCWINQQVTIGATDTYDYPTIGDNVHILAGALVLGNIIVGNNAIIGAGAVVTKNVPDNCVVIGNPAYICRRNGIRVHEKL